MPPSPNSPSESSAAPISSTSAPAASPRPRERPKGINAIKRERAAARAAQNKAGYDSAKGTIYNKRCIVKWLDPRVDSAWDFLNPREQRFVELASQGMDYDKAYAAAGYRAKRTYHQLVRRPLIRAALYQKGCAVMREADISTGQIFREIAKIGFMPDDLLSERISPREKVKCLELMTKIMNMVVTNVNVRAKVGVAHLFGQATEAAVKNTLAAQSTNLLGKIISDAIAPAIESAVREHD